MKLKYLFLVLLLGTMSCTQQTCAKQFGGNYNGKIPCGQKVIEMTWKGDQLWIATTEMDSSDVPRVLNFQEDSSWGVLEGTVTITERRCD